MPKFKTLGNRMKFYEKEFNGDYLMPYVPAVVRLDGKAFHTFTKDLDKPFDEGLSILMDLATKALVAETNACIGYTQSDEITLILYSNNRDSQIYFDGRRDKINTSLAITCSQVFNEGIKEYLPKKTGEFVKFDCRCFSVPNKSEAINAVVWREKDAVRNSIQMLGQANFEHNQLQSKSCDEIQEMLFQQKQINWNNLKPRYKRGAYFQKKIVTEPFSCEEIEKLPEKHVARKNPNMVINRNKIIEVDMPIITKVANLKEVFFENQEPCAKTEG